MTIIVDGRDRITRTLEQLERQMASLAEEIQSLQTALSAAQDRVTNDLQNLNKQVADLQSQVQTLQNAMNNATLTADQQAALDAVIAGIQNLDVPEAPPAPAPLPQGRR